eukprot:gene11592-14196_t
MANNKSPGPDGLTSGFYKQHLQQITPSLLSPPLSFNSPSPFKEGTLIVIFKKGDKNDISTTLLNTDYKIYSKILKTRLLLTAL